MVFNNRFLFVKNISKCYAFLSFLREGKGWKEN